ncbi:hypothetical protein BT69DRAFT_1244570, partial [Atractiella rhizophila]
TTTTKLKVAHLTAFATLSPLLRRLETVDTQAPPLRIYIQPTCCSPPPSDPPERFFRSSEPLSRRVTHPVNKSTPLPP